MAGQIRERAGYSRLGHQRYQRYVDAFDRVTHCVEKEYYLEAIAILDSLIGDRLASRLSYLLGKEVPVRLTCGQLSRALIRPSDDRETGAETDSAFRLCVEELEIWARKRNTAMHATARIFRSGEKSKAFSELSKAHEEVAVQGIELLQKFDHLDTMARRANRKTPATHPHAFFPKKRKRS